MAHEKAVEIATNMSPVSPFFRSAARACAEDSLGWASSVFPINDVRSRSVSKLPSLGKHKLPFPDLNKPSKSKFKRTSAEHGEMRHPSGERTLQPLPTFAAPIDLNLFNLSSPISTDVQIDDPESNVVADINKMFSLEMEGEAVEHGYVPSFISGLDDCPLFPEFTDIG